MSKFYSSGETFQPEDVVSVKLKPSPGFNATIIAAERPAREFRQQPVVLPPTGDDTAAGRSQQETDEVPDQVNRQKTRSRNTSPLPPQAGMAIEQTDERSGDQRNDGPDEAAGTISTEEMAQRLKEAYDNGLTTGRAQAEQDFANVTATFLAACRQLDSLHETIIANSSAEIQELVLAIAERIIRHSVADQSVTIVATVEEAIRKTMKSEEITIHVHPDDLAVINSRIDGIQNEIDDLNRIVIKPDNSVEQGGCRIEAENCTVDATISGQLEVIRERLGQQ